MRIPAIPALFLLAACAGGETVKSVQDEVVKEAVRPDPVAAAEMDSIISMDPQEKDSPVKEARHSVRKSPFRLVSASYEDWVAGRRDAGSGTEYYFRILVNTADVRFDSVWVNNQRLELYPERKGPEFTDGPVKYAAGDTVTFRASLVHQEGEPGIIPPVTLNGTALIRYKLGGKSNFYSVKTMTKTITANRP